MRTLVVVGRSTIGKSSVSNSIFGSKTFSPRNTTEKTRLTNERGSNNEFTVVDCSGIGDTEEDIAGDMKSVIASAYSALMLCDKQAAIPLNGDKSYDAPSLSNDNNEKPVVISENQTWNVPASPTTSPLVGDEIQTSQDLEGGLQSSPDLVDDRECGFDALIFVLKYGVRFTKQEKDAVQMVKSIFGDNVFRNWGILVFSYGDNFYLDTEDEGTTFEEWCREQTGDIRNLFEEVDYRCVIFDNRQKHSKLQDKERKKLLEINAHSQRPYSEQDFLAASAGREKLILLEKFESLKNETDAVLRYTDQGRESLLRNDQGLDKNDLIRQLEVILQQTQKHYNKLLEEDKGTNVLRALLDQVRLRTIGLRSRIDQLLLVLPDRGRKRNERGCIAALFYNFLGFILNIFRIYFEYCLKPLFYFIYGLVIRCLQYFVYTPAQNERVGGKYAA